MIVLCNTNCADGTAIALSKENFLVRHESLIQSDRICSYLKPQIKSGKITL